MFGFGATVEVITVARDNHGDETITVTDVLPGCAVAPGSSTEDNDNRAQVATDVDLFCDLGDVEITAQHQVRLPDGSRWRVDGTPQQWPRPYSGGTAGTVIRLRRVTG